MRLHFFLPLLFSLFFIVFGFQNCSAGKWATGTTENSSSEPIDLSGSTDVKVPHLFNQLSDENNSTDTKCNAIDTTSWKACLVKINSGPINTIEINGEIICNDSSCSLQLQNKKSISILGTKNAKIYRTSGFDKPLLSFSRVDNVVISSVDFFDIENIPYKVKSGDQEINSHCLKYSSQNCEPIVSIQSAVQVEIRKSKFTNGKIFGISLVNNDKVFVSDSTFENAWWFGIWGKDNRLLEFDNNQFLNNRSNAFLMTFEKSEKSLINNNYFSGNHHATAFHVCGSGTEPCPGAQIDLTQQVNNVEIVNNTFINGQLSMEYPEDSNHNWISAIEFEPHDKNISNVQIHNNTIKNNSGSEFYINLPTGDQNRQLLNGFSFFNNSICNNKSQGTVFGPGFKWGLQINSYGNTNCNETTASCATPSVYDKTTNSCICKSPNVMVNGICQTSISCTSPLTLDTATNSCVCKSPNVMVNGICQQPPPQQQPKITSAGLGCSQNECLWIQGLNFSSVCSVDIYKSDWSKLLARVEKTTCTATVVTFKIPTEILNSETSFHLTVINQSGLWTDPYFFKIKP